MKTIGVGAAWLVFYCLFTWAWLVYEGMGMDRTAYFWIDEVWLWPATYLPIGTFAKAIPNGLLVALLGAFAYRRGNPRT